MTEKRFYNDGKYVMQKGGVWVVVGGKHSADVIATALNELIEEINRLQFAYNMEILTRQSIEKKNNDLKSTLAYRSNQLALMEQLIDDLASEEMKRQMEVILNE